MSRRRRRDVIRRRTDDEGFYRRKKEELYRALEKIDDREWKSFRAWCGGRTADFGEWPERLAIYEYEIFKNGDYERDEDMKRGVW